MLYSSTGIWKPFVNIDLSSVTPHIIIKKLRLLKLLKLIWIKTIHNWLAILDVRPFNFWKCIHGRFRPNSQVSLRRFVLIHSRGMMCKYINYCFPSLVKPAPNEIPTQIRGCCLHGGAPVYQLVQPPSPWIDAGKPRPEDDQKDRRSEQWKKYRRALQPRLWKIIKPSVIKEPNETKYGWSLVIGVQSLFHLRTGSVWNWGGRAARYIAAIGHIQPKVMPSWLISEAATGKHHWLTAIFEQKRPKPRVQHWEVQPVCQHKQNGWSTKGTHGSNGAG